MAKSTKDRMTGVQSQPTSEIDSEILGSIAALDNGSDNDDGDDGATERPRIPVSKAKEAGGLNAEAVQRTAAARASSRRSSRGSYSFRGASRTRAFSTTTSSPCTRRTRSSST